MFAEAGREIGMFGVQPAQAVVARTEVQVAGAHTKSRGFFEVGRFDFIGRFLHDLMFYDLPQAFFTAMYVGFTLLVALTLIAVPPRWRGRKIASV